MAMEIYKKLPSLYHVLVCLFNHILRGGDISSPLRQIDMVPIPKPGKGPRNPNNRKPISLIC